MSEKLWSLYASYELIVMGDLKLDWLSDSFDNSRAHKLFQVVAAILVLSLCLSEGSMSSFHVFFAKCEALVPSKSILQSDIVLPGICPDCYHFGLLEFFSL